MSFKPPGEWHQILPVPPKLEEVVAETFTHLDACKTQPPATRERVDWKLLTGLPLADGKTAIQLLAKYSARWKMEVLHKISKSGCRTEQTHLRTADRLTNLYTSQRHHRRLTALKRGNSAVEPLAWWTANRTPIQ